MALGGEEHKVEERSKTAPKHPKTAARASRYGRYFTSIHIDNNNTGRGFFVVFSKCVYVVSLHPVTSGRRVSRGVTSFFLCC